MAWPESHTARSHSHSQRYTNPGGQTPPSKLQLGDPRPPLTNFVHGVFSNRGSLIYNGLRSIAMFFNSYMFFQLAVHNLVTFTIIIVCGLTRIDFVVVAFDTQYYLLRLVLATKPR